MTPSKVKQILLQNGYEYIGMTPSELLESMAECGILSHDGSLDDATERKHAENMGMLDEYDEQQDWS